MTADRPNDSPQEPPDRPSERAPENGPPRRPTPVRELMEKAREETVREEASREEASREKVSREEAASAPESVRTVDIEGEAWTVRVEGATRSGSGQDAGAPLLFLTFTRGAEDGGGPRGQGAPEREALAVGASLGDLSDDALAELFSRSRAYRTRDD